jgi:hypothetical protein
VNPKFNVKLAGHGEKACGQEIQPRHKCQCDRKKGHRGIHICRAGFWRDAAPTPSAGEEPWKCPGLASGGPGKCSREKPCTYCNPKFQAPSAGEEK